MEQWRGGRFLIAAAPGAGKTIPSIEQARRMLHAGTIDRVVVVCPTAPLTRQWAAAAGRMGLHLVPDAPTPKPPRDFVGVAVTYARIASAPSAWARDMSKRTLIIADEAHHLGEELSWGVGFAEACQPASHWLLLSGTPFRSDATPIPGVRYDRDGVAVPDVAYTYADSVRDGICRPVVFVTYDGTLSWRSGDETFEAGFDTVLTAREASRRYRTAISTELPDGLPRILREAHERLVKVRAGGHRDAAGLVVAADGGHARKVAKLLRDATGKAPTVVLHTEANASRKLAAFREGREEWIVAVNMVSEGVDIPRLRVGVYATAAKTPLVFRQIVGRFVRTEGGAGRPEPSYLYLPADPVLRDHAESVETDLRGMLRRRTEEEDLAFDEPAERRETERGEVEEWVPVAADVAPQMALFGGGPEAPKVIAPSAHAFAAAAPVPEAAGEAAPAEPQLSAFERREILRDKRHRLVGDLGRRDRRTHAEINAWLNRAVGIGRVEDATIEQLDKSISLLLDELSGASSRR